MNHEAKHNLSYFRLCLASIFMAAFCALIWFILHFLLPNTKVFYLPVAAAVFILAPRLGKWCYVSSSN